MSVFKDIADACAAQLLTDADLPPARSDDDVASALAQNRAADVLITLGTSTEDANLAQCTDWRTDIIVNITARPLGNKSAATMCDLYTARVLQHLRAGNAAFVASLAPYAAIGINSNTGDRRIRRDITRTDTAMAEAEVTLAIYHRTVGDSLDPWPA